VHATPVRPGARLKSEINTGANIERRQPPIIKSEINISQCPLVPIRGFTIGVLIGAAPFVRMQRSSRSNVAGIHARPPVAQIAPALRSMQLDLIAGEGEPILGGDVGRDFKHAGD
jgi:hypothetical protein